MPTDTGSLTLALALTAGGAVAFAALITGVVEILKGRVPGVRGNEQTAALILAAVVVLLAMVSAIQSAVLTLGIESGFAAFLAWYGITRLAMGIHDDITRSPNSLTGPSS